jgi:catechol 2,3-dioxygenase-like lactoylglutathione lyase family enzyme
VPGPAIDHLGLSVSDYTAAKRFYVAALQPLGLTLGREFPKSVTGDFDVGLFGPGGQALLIIAGGGKATPAVHLAFRAEKRAAVDAFYAAAIANGGTANGPPGIRTHYHANYYAAFVLDPDGNNIEAVSHVPE